LPAPVVTVPSVSVELPAALPRKLSAAPLLRVMLGVADRRFALLAAVLSSVRAPPALIVILPAPAASGLKFRAALLKLADLEHDSLRFYFLGHEWQRRVEHHGAKPTVNPEGPLLV